MDAVFVLAVGALVTASVYMFLARDLPRVLIGFVLLGTGANLAIFASGRVGPMTPALVDPGAATLAANAANSLPQALVLTAIVIGFGLTAFALMLVVKSYTALQTISAEEMHEAEVYDEAPSSTNKRATPGRAPKREAA